MIDSLLTSASRYQGHRRSKHYFLNEFTIKFYVLTAVCKTNKYIYMRHTFVHDRMFLESMLNKTSKYYMLGSLLTNTSLI